MISSFFQRGKSLYPWERLAVYVILLLGIVFRMRQFLTGRSLWLDEAMLALNIVNRDLTGLLQPLEYEQGAPIGFLIVEKIFNILFGEHEFVLRLFPLLAGITSLILFYLLLRRTISGIGLLTGLALFAIGPELIYYSSEVKQYSLDVAVTTGLLLLAQPGLAGQANKRNYIYIVLAGIFGMWFSHPAIFVLVGIGIGLLNQVLSQGERSQLRLVLLMGFIWLANLGLIYFVSLRGLSRNAFLMEYWQENFMPIPPWSDWSWFVSVFEGFIQNQIGLQILPWLVFIFLILGAVYLWIKNKNYCVALSVVFLAGLAASAIRLYPLGGRLSLFLVPVAILLISQSIHMLEQSHRMGYKSRMLIAWLIGVFLLYTPVSESLSNFINPKYFEHIRPSMAALSKNWKQGDVLFVSNGAIPAFNFYADRYGLGDVVYQTSEAADYLQPENILANLQALDGNSRVWVLVTHVYETNNFNENDFLLSFLNAMGNHKREFRSPGTSVYLNLYDLSP